MGDGRTPGQQLKDLAGLFTGKNKIENNRIVSKNPPPPQQPPDDGEDINVNLNIRR
jgi:hypothetical protein